ncbi:hypothetical protein RZS08_13495, partial [Arthrospira platensis SPKY1]|nr:hypothetical protein [Arthrospira platensis SPKY1]
LNAIVSRMAIELEEGMETIDEQDLRTLAEALEDEVETAVKLSREAVEAFGQFEDEFAAA